MRRKGLPVTSAMYLERRGFRTTYVAAGRNLAAVLSIGALSGFLVGGVGGRLAMLILRLASAPSLEGAFTEDGLVIGRFSGESAFLLAAATLGGLFLAPLYVVARDWLPARGRPVLFGIWTGVLGGGAILQPAGADFVGVGRPWLAVLLFIALPAAFGAVPAALLERWFRTRRPPSVLPMLPLTVLPMGIVMLPVLAICALFLALDRHRRIDGIWRARRMTTMGRITLAAGLCFGLYELALAIPAIL